MNRSGQSLYFEMFAKCDALPSHLAFLQSYLLPLPPLPHHHQLLKKHDSYISKLCAAKTCKIILCSFLSKKPVPNPVLSYHTMGKWLLEHVHFMVSEDYLTNLMET